MNGQVMHPKDFVRRVSVDVTNDLIWHSHVVAAGKNLGSSNIMQSSDTTLVRIIALLDAVQKGCICLVNNPTIT